MSCLLLIVHRVLLKWDFKLEQKDLKFQTLIEIPESSGEMILQTLSNALFKLCATGMELPSDIILSPFTIIPAFSGHLFPSDSDFLPEV